MSVRPLVRPSVCPSVCHMSVFCCLMFQRQLEEPSLGTLFSQWWQKENATDLVFKVSWTSTDLYLITSQSVKRSSLQPHQISEGLDVCFQNQYSCYRTTMWSWNQLLMNSVCRAAVLLCITAAATSALCCDVSRSYVAAASEDIATTTKL